MKAIDSATTPEGLEAARVEYLGTKGLFAELMKSLGALPKEDRPRAGGAANAARQKVTEAHLAAKEALEEKAAGSKGLDVTLPGRRPPGGHRHVISRTTADICDI